MRWTTIGLAVVIAIASAPVSARSEGHSVWVWSPPSTIEASELTDAGFNEVYLWAPPGFSADSAFETFLDEAHTAGLAVFAVGGDPSWADSPSLVRTWAREVAHSGQWDGVVLDIEPYLHPEWQTDQADLVRDYLRGLRSANHQLSVPMHVAVPFWFDEVTYKSTTVLDHVVRRADGIVVLAYRDHASGIDGILELSAEEVAAAEQRRRTIVIAVETGEVEPAKVTFFEEGRSALETELDVVREALAASPSFGGTSVHHWEAFQALGD